MNKRWPTLLSLIPALALLLLPVARAAPPGTPHVETAQVEINYLLEPVGQSDCEFNRNGTWYGSKRAQEHLRYKYDWLVRHDRISTTEDFIDLAATKSSITGRPYQIRCKDGQVVTSDQWLRDALACFRTTGAQCAPRDVRGAPASDEQSG